MRMLLPLVPGDCKPGNAGNHFKWPGETFEFSGRNWATGGVINGFI
jgi:hypothetical protein